MKQELLSNKNIIPSPIHTPKEKRIPQSILLSLTFDEYGLTYKHNHTHYPFPSHRYILGKKYGKFLAPLPLLSIVGLYEYKHRTTAPAPLQDKYITFKTEKARKRWEGKKIPAGILTTLFLDDEIDFVGDVLEALENADEFICYLPSWGVLKFLILQLFPNVGNSSVKDKKTTKREIAEVRIVYFLFRRLGNL